MYAIGDSLDRWHANREDLVPAYENWLDITGNDPDSDKGSWDAFTNYLENLEP